MTPTQFLELFLSLSVQAAILIGLTFGICRSIRDERGTSRVWTACYALLLLMLVGAVVLPHLRLLQRVPTLERHLAAEIVSIEMTSGRVLGTIWLLGCGVSLGLFIYRSIQAERFLRRCRPVDPAVISLDRDVFRDGDGRTGRLDPGGIRLVSSPAVSGPFCWQFHRPYIVIPESLLSARPDELRFILRHEIEHLQTGHPLQVFLQHAVEIVFWYHPLVWWASRESALAREVACDAAAVANRGELIKYLKTLLSIVERNAAPGVPAPAALAFGRNRHMLTKRVQRLVDVAGRKENRPGRRLLTRVWAVSAPGLLAMCAAFASCVWLPVNLMASPHGAWSPWPAWTARVLHDFGVETRDFELYDHRYELHELLEKNSAEGAQNGSVEGRPE